MNEQELKDLNEKLSLQLKTAEDKLEKMVADGLAVKADEYAEKVDKLTEAIDAVELKMNRPGFGGGAGKEIETKADIERKQANDDFLRKGDVSANSLEQKFMSVSDDVSGGYLASEEMVNEIIKVEVESSNLGDVARNRTTSKKSVLIPVKKQAMTAYWVGEGKAPAESELKFGLVRLPVNKLVAVVIVTDEDLDDSDFNLQQEITSDAKEQFEVAEGAGFVTGNGIEKPFGLLVDDAIGEIESNTASVLDADDLINLFYEVKTKYSNKGTYRMNRSTLKVVRKLKDGEGRYLFSPAGSLKDVPWATINGARVIEDSEMPDIADGSFPVMFGDYNKAYTVVRRKQITILRDALTLAAQGKIKFVITKRITGKTVLGEAVARIKIKVA